MSAPDWWVIAVPTLTVVVAVVVGVYANVKTLHDIRKTQLDIEKTKLELQKLRADLAEKDKRIVIPTDDDVRNYSEYGVKVLVEERKIRHIEGRFERDATSLREEQLRSCLISIPIGYATWLLLRDLWHVLPRVVHYI